MARRRNKGGNGAGPAGEQVRREDRLMPAAWLDSLLVYKTNRDLLADMKEAQEGFDPEGMSALARA